MMDQKLKVWLVIVIMFIIGFVGIGCEYDEPCYHSDNNIEEYTWKRIASTITSLTEIEVVCKDFNETRYISLNIYIETQKNEPIYIPLEINLETNDDWNKLRNEFSRWIEVYEDGDLIRRYEKTKKLLDIDLSQSNLTKIYSAFSDLAGLIKITIPDNVISIEYAAFWGCTSLTNIILPKGLISIGVHAFRNTGLKEISLPESLEFIDSFAFTGTSIKNITLPASLTTIGENNPFSQTSIIFTVTNNSTFSVIDEGKGLVQDNTILVSYPTASGTLTIPYGWDITAGTFAGSNLTNVNLPANITSIEQDTFFGCNLIYINLPVNLTSIERDAFWGCTNLTNITFPENLRYIGPGAFENCTSLTSVTFMGIITSGNFSPGYPGPYGSLLSYTFPGDLRVKYLAGGPGTYTRSASSEIWTKQ